MSEMKKSYKLAFSIFLFSTFILGMVQWKVENPMLLAERFWHGAGWVEVLIVGIYGGLVGFNMYDIKKAPRWRKATWLTFSLVLFFQLLIGVLLDETFLMTGKLHLPVPAIILAGPVYRFEVGFMTILFLSTIILSGPAWCSQLCYFGAWDSVMAKGKPQKGSIMNRTAIKASGVVIVIIIALLLRLFHVGPLISTIFGVSLGVLGVLVMIFFSRRQGKMIHCLTWCPIGTLVSILKYVNPFRMQINQSSCTHCMACTAACRYDALNVEDIENGKPAYTCTLCGDCLPSCHSNAIEYRFLGLSPSSARTLWLFITISLHTVFMVLARI